MKFRKSGKIKKQHGMIKGLRRFLEKIEHWDEIQGIIPGRIEVAKQSGKVQLRVSYHTTSGLKAIARGNSSVQEVFFISSKPTDLSNRLSKLLESH